MIRGNLNALISFIYKGVEARGDDENSGAVLVMVTSIKYSIEGEHALDSNVNPIE